MRAASSRHCTDERSLARPLLVALLAAVMLLQQANCQPACPGADAVGTAFSVTSWTCTNYTAVFSWSLDLSLADTSLHLLCSNGSDEYSPDTKTTHKTSLSQTYSLPLTGSVQCTLSGCYEDLNLFDAYLIPSFEFICLPPITPTTLTPTTTGYEAGEPTTSTHHILPSPSPPPSKYPPSGTELYPSNPATYDTRIPQPSSSPKDTRDRETTSQGLIVVVVAVPLSSVFGAVILLSLFVFCFVEIHRRFCSYSGKCVVDMQQDDKFDPNFSLKLTDYQLCHSTNTLLESPLFTPPLPTTHTPSTPTSSTSHSDEIDQFSLANSQQALHSLCSEQLTSDSHTHTDRNEGVTPESKIAPDNAVCHDTSVTIDAATNTSTSARGITASSYVCESDLSSCTSGAPSTSFSTTHITRDSSACCPYPPSPLPYLVDDEPRLEKESVSNDGDLTALRSGEIHHSPATPQAMPYTHGGAKSSADLYRPHSLSITANVADSEDTVLKWLSASKRGEDHGAPQSTAPDEVPEEQCDEVVMGLVERFTHSDAGRPSVVSTTSSSSSTSGTSSGLSTGSYLQWSTTEH